MQGNFLLVDPTKDFTVLRGLASQARIAILSLLIRPQGLHTAPEEMF